MTQIHIFTSDIPSILPFLLWVYELTPPYDNLIKDIPHISLQIMKLYHQEISQTSKYPFLNHTNSIQYFTFKPRSSGGLQIWDGKFPIPLDGRDYGTRGFLRMYGACGHEGSGLMRYPKVPTPPTRTGKTGLGDSEVWPPISSRDGGDRGGFHPCFWFPPGKGVLDMDVGMVPRHSR